VLNHLVMMPDYYERTAGYPGLEHYRPRKRELVMRIKWEEEWVNRPEVWLYEVCQRLCQDILAAVDRVPQFGVKDFDHRAFRRDLEALFHERGWLGPPSRLRLRLSGRSEEAARERAEGWDAFAEVLVGTVLSAIDRQWQGFYNMDAHPTEQDMRWPRTFGRWAFRLDTAHPRLGRTRQRVALRPGEVLAATVQATHHAPLRGDSPLLVARLVLRLYDQAAGGTLLAEEARGLTDQTGIRWKTQAVGLAAPQDCWAEVWAENPSDYPVWYSQFHIEVGPGPLPDYLLPPLPDEVLTARMLAKVGL
jgi:hypothetical protein